ncbi:ATPase [Erythrobacter sp. YT30]|nr:ATPase [Erythrobacter sp. YT30]
MSEGSHIRAVGRSTKHNASTDSANETGEHDTADELELSSSDEVDDDGDVLDLTEMDQELEFLEEIEPPRAGFGWVLPSLAILTIIGWTGLYGWAMQSDLLNAASVAPAQWVNWIIDWSVPVLLVCVIWLLAMRNSRREADRFAITASLLSQESAQLENRLTVVNRELSLAREFLASQSRDLESLGRVASERISEHAATLQDLIKKNDKQVQSIGKASDTALINMSQLRDDLPVIATSARDVSNQIGNAGRTAKEQAEALVGEFKKLEESGASTDSKIADLSSRVNETLGEFDSEMSRLEQTVSERFDLLQNKAAEYRSEVDQTEAQAYASLSGRFAGLQGETDTLLTKLRDAEKLAGERQEEAIENLQTSMTELFDQVDELDRNAIEAAKTRLDSLKQEAIAFDDLLTQRDIRFMAEMKSRQDQFEQRETRGSEMMAARLADLDTAMMKQREAQAEETQKFSEQSAALSDQFGEMGSLIKQIASQTDVTRRSLAEGLGDLGKQLSEKRLSLGQTAEALNELNKSALKLLENIELGVHHTREELPEAIKNASSELSDVEKRAGEVKGIMLSTSEHGEELSSYLTNTHGEIEKADASIDALQNRLSEHADEALAKLQGLRGGLAQVADESEEFAGTTQERLREAILSLETATRSTFGTLETETKEKIEALAEEISSKAAGKLSESLQAESNAAIAQMEAAAALASGAGRDATAQLRDQLAKVNELTGNLEQRIRRARELAEEQVNNDFSRRMALITDSLNSSSIDIASALSSEVSDTEWNSYLKGDRGIFTRRAVRLIDNPQAKEIAELYQSDDDFHANVNRYIHDFEAMLRSMLSTRDGNALGVTVLGSDMGKLYVALAQGIERLRT